jgi:putative transcriptional regulator
MDLVGKCLIARPSIVDPFFKRSVVYIYEQNMQGVAGLVINKRKGSFTTTEIMLNRGFDPLDPAETVYAGGPVNETAVILLHTNEWSSSNTLQVDKHLSVSSDDLMFFKITNGDKPNGYKFCCGVAAWHPKQIVTEIKANHWLISELNTHQIFDVDGRQLWDEAVETNAKQTIDKFI